ncbi:MAG: hypothetical protein Kow0096_05300 [Thiohalomonadaceae bacterium]
MHTTGTDMLSLPHSATTAAAPTERLRSILAIFFSLLFLALSIAFAVVSLREFVAAVSEPKGLTSGLIAAINAAVISLAAFELGFNVGKEYVQESDDDIYAAVRRSIARFVGVVCIALVLEGLIMVIKYSQLELAGNLGYPVAIIGGASLLLIALGVFLFLTRPEQHPHAHQTPLDTTPAQALPHRAERV